MTRGRRMTVTRIAQYGQVRTHPRGESTARVEHLMEQAGFYRPMTRTVKLPGIMAGRGWGSVAVGLGRGPNSAVTV